MLLICCLGLSTIVKPKAFQTAQWNIDVKPLSNIEVQRLHSEVIDCFSKGGKHGGYDMVHLLMGSKAADRLLDNEFVLARSHPSASQPIASGSKRKDCVLESSSDVDEEQPMARKVSRRR